MPRARDPNLKEHSVSLELSRVGEQHTISIVLELPPIESCRTLVSLLSLYGMCLALSSDNAAITFAKALNDLLIRIPSSVCRPEVPVLAIRSLPARSTMQSLPSDT